MASKVTKELGELLHRVSKSNPKREDVAALRDYFKENPGVWRIAGDVALLATEDLVQRVVSSPEMRESLYQGWAEMLQELGYSMVSQLERLLIDQVVLCWLRLSYREWQYTNVTSESIPIAQADFWERRLSAAQRRFFRACETLARVRRLLRPKVAQVNIGAQ